MDEKLKTALILAFIGAAMWLVTIAKLKQKRKRGPQLKLYKQR